MEVNDALINNLAQLTRLEFNDAERDEIKNDLQKMIAFIDKLNELDTTGVEPLLHMSENVNVLREDEVKGSISREEALKNAPLHDEQFFKVPKVIKSPLFHEGGTKNGAIH
ncbi:MAG: gatC [Chitinophagaceae bacterium]|nr:gatC [Chitinophagaceae bacterium]